MKLFWIIASAWLGLSLPAHASCGARLKPCAVDAGDYHALVPDQEARETPVVMMLHGLGSSGAGTLRNNALRSEILSRGYALIAPNGLPRNPDGTGPRRWAFLPGTGQRDEAAFLAAVIKDAAIRFGTSAERVILAGFSNGAFTVNYIACQSPEAFAAFAPVAGGFWRPHPAQCRGAVRLLHTHGWADRTVPLEGRFLGGGEYQQGDIFAGLEIWRDANACRDENPDGFETSGPFLRRRWENCASGSALEMALFPGGHKIPAGWATMLIDWFEALPR